MISALRRWWRRFVDRRRSEKVLRECGCVCYCPKCKEPLNDNADVHYSAEGLVVYACRNCGQVSEWSFDIAPLPVLRKP